MTNKNFWENFILAAIVLVIVQTFLDDFAVYMHWSVGTRNILLVSAFVFDFIFSAEFTVRTVLAGKKGSVTRYWLYERGWVDFLSSIPLLLLNSGPALLLLLIGGAEEGALAIGVLNVLKVVKAIRVTRILRLIRIIKIFGKIQNAESPMAQHHTSTISTTAVFTIICVLMAFSLFTTTPHEEKIRAMEKEYASLVDSAITLSKAAGKPERFVLKEVFSGDRDVIRIERNGKTLLANIKKKEFKNYYDIHDYHTMNASGLGVVLSLVDINRHVAYNNLLHFFIIVVTVLSFMIIYTRHFAQTISDLIHVMNQGFRKKSYNLQVKIRDEYKDEEIFKLAKFYNDAYLPSKIAKLQRDEMKKTSGISMDFLKGFKG